MKTTREQLNYYAGPYSRVHYPVMADLADDCLALEGSLKEMIEKYETNLTWKARVDELAKRVTELEREITVGECEAEKYLGATARGLVVADTVRLVAGKEHITAHIIGLKNRAYLAEQELVQLRAQIAGATSPEGVERARRAYDRYPYRPGSDNRVTITEAMEAAIKAALEVKPSQQCEDCGSCIEHDPNCPQGGWPEE